MHTLHLLRRSWIFVRGILCAVVHHTFFSTLERLRAQLRREPSSPSRTVCGRGKAKAAEAPSTQESTRLRKRRPDGADGAAAAEQQLTSTKRRREAAPCGMSKAAYTKAGRAWIDKYNDGKCSAEKCVKKLEALLDKFSPMG